MTTAPPIKMETDGMVKPDPDVRHPQPMEEDDDFEDTGELEMPPQPHNVWLLRIPRVLHEQWNKIDQDQEMQIGIIRRGKKSGKLTMLLDPKLPLYEMVERDYSIRPINERTKNTYVFSEKDLPGFKKSSKNGRRNSDNHPGANKGGVDKNKRFQRKIIPKQTRLTHAIAHESLCMPVENDVTRAIRKKRQLDEEANRPQVNFDTNRAVAPEIQGVMNFNKNKRDVIGLHRGKAAKPKPQENKAARMPRAELLDKLFRCFNTYQYWSMKALRDELKQPEAYLKENLDAIADLVRSGRFNGLYTLKPESRPQNFSTDDVKQEAAPEEEDESELEALSGGDDEDMEDASDVKDEPT
ncbi:MAG: hypothetical protein Q9162_007445 [Coniocarpon cinnabarinum]